MIKPILKKDTLDLPVGSRNSMTATVTSVEIVKDKENMTIINPMVNSYFCPVGLKVFLSNGFQFYTPKHFQYEEMGVQGITRSVYEVGNTKTNWGSVTEVRKESWESPYGKQTDFSNTLTPSVNVGDVITVKGTVQPRKRLNRVVLVSEA